MGLLEQLLLTFEPRCLEPAFGPAFLRRYAKQRTCLSPGGWTRYALEADIKLNGSHYGLRFTQKYFDTTFNFCLTHDAMLIATLGFEVDNEAMNIWQIQGVKGQQRWLEPIKWSLALVQYAVEWAARNGFAEAYVASVEHNRWAAQHAHLDPCRGKLLYDVTAKRCGFKRGGDGYYRRALSSTG